MSAPGGHARVRAAIGAAWGTAPVVVPVSGGPPRSAVAVRFER